MGLGSKIRFMFVATDSVSAGVTGTWVEAAVDDIAIMELGNGPTVVNDITTLQSAVYPNPASTSFTILTPEKGTLKYVLTNSIGEVLIQKSEPVNPSGKLSVDVSHLASAVYFLKLELNGKQSIHKVSIRK
jgi:hypothetical protein